MRQLIPHEVLEDYTILILPVPDIEEWHVTKLDFAALPDCRFLNVHLREDFIAPIPFIENEESCLLLMDKVNNHALQSFMILQAGRNIKRGFNELTSYELSTLFSLYTNFTQYSIEHCNFQNLRPRFSFNNDPLTRDRPGLQSIERFHAHIYLLSTDRLNEGRCLSFKDLLTSPAYKDYFDPGAFCLEQVILDLHKFCIDIPSELFLIEESLLSKVQNKRGLGLNILFQGDAEFFKQPAFIEYVKSLDRVFRKFHNEFIQHSVQDYSINHIRAKTYIDSCHWMSKKTKSQLLEFLGALHDLPSSSVQKLLRKPRFAKNIIAYRAPCYSLSIDLLNPWKNLYQVNFYPRVFSEIGGAGIFGLLGYNAIVLDRNKKKLFSAEEIATRRAFQNAFIHYISRHDSYTLHHN